MTTKTKKTTLSKIEIAGKMYPCRETMGAFLRYKNETGHEASEMQTVSDWCTYLYCCIKSACNADGVEFGYDLEMFADLIEADTLTQWVNLYVERLAEAQKDAAPKKK